jgi:RNA polymerase sigma factor (sigma-70 family)
MEQPVPFAHPNGVTALELTSADLVARIVTGDGRAEDEMVQRYRQGIFTIVRHLVGGGPALEDLTQESLLLAIAKVRRGEVRQPECLSGFVCSVARNIAIAYLRQPVLTAGADASQAPSHEPDPQDEFLKTERAGAVRRALAEMKSARDREVLYRFYIAEETKESICARLRLSSLNFNRVLCRARERFRGLYEDRTARKTAAAAISNSGLG